MLKQERLKEKMKNKNHFFKWFYVVKYIFCCKENTLQGVKNLLYFLLKNTPLTNAFFTARKYVKQGIRSIRYSCQLLRDRPLWWQYAFSKTTFLLCIRPKNSPWRFPFFKRRYYISQHFPPPGYGIPPGYDSFIKQHNYRPKKDYGLYLFPGRINFAFIFLTFFLSILVFSPLIYDRNHTYGPMIVIYWLFAYLFYQFLFTKMMPASLDQVWEKWPIPAYELFLSVPHTIHIAKQDRFTTITPSSQEDDDNANGKVKSDKAEQFLSCYQKPKQHIFWRPDTKTPMWRQSTENAPDMHTLQELILNLAVFEFLFHNNDHQAGKTIEKNNKNNKNKTGRTIPQAESIREYHWYFFLFSPILINLLLILLAIFLFSTLNGHEIKTYKVTDFQLITHFPYNIVLAVLTWFLFTLFYVSWILETLTDLSKKIRQDYFNTQLDLIPQQILNELSYIPTQQHVDNSIAYVKTILNWSSSIIFIGLMAVLEIFSQAASRLHVDYAVWENLKNLFNIGG